MCGIVNSVPILIVTCLRDIKQAIIMIESLEKFLIKEHSIHVILNEKINQRQILLKQLLEEKLKHVSGKHQYHTYDAEYFVKLPEKTISKFDGWLNQQILKILGAKYINSDNVLVLDTKMYLVNNCNAEDLNRQERVKITNHPYKETFIQYAKMFGCECQEYAVQFTTPFNLEKPVIDYICEIFSPEQLVDFFYSHWKVSEFILYNVISWKIKHKLSVVLTDTQFDARLFVFWAPFNAEKKNTSYSQDIDFVINSIHKKEILLCGIHRFAWVEMCEKEKREYMNLMFNLGLTQDINLNLFDDGEIYDIVENLKIKREESIKNLWN